MVLYNLASKKVYQIAALNLILFKYVLLFCTGCQSLLTPQKDAMPKEYTHMLIAIILIPICKHLESLGI